jgi:uncharacterized protein (TIGR03437 family)
MRFAGFTLALAGIFAGNALGQAPTVGGLLNNYSYTLPGLPNYGIAQGSIVAIFGTNFSSTNVSASLPLQTTLNGVTINVTVNGTTTQPLIYFVGPGQINAVLPSATPVGTGTIAVTTSAGASAAFPIQVVESAFGLLTFNNGSGPVSGYDASNSYASMNFLAASNPGDVLELWGTGLGPVQDDATGGAVSAPAEVLIGGISATLNYHGRSQFIGLDQINVVVPAGVSGCNVSVVVVTGSYVSNFGTLAVAASGRTCADASNPLSTAILDKIAQTGTFSVGVVSLNEITTPGIDGIGAGTTVVTLPGTTENGGAIFFKITAAQFNAGAHATASIGSCAVSFYNASATSQIPPPAFTFTYLNAGLDVNINGPDGAIAMPLQTVQSGGNTINVYSTPQADTSFIPASGGTFNFDNGSGGPDVGAFTAQLQMASPLVWSNMGSISTVTRSNGLTVNWTGGDPSTYASITGLSFGSVNGSITDFVVGDFTCQAPTSAGTFTVPSAVLLSLPASTTIAGISFSALSVSSHTGPVTFTATGLDVGWAEASVENTITVTYQ